MPGRPTFGTREILSPRKFIANSILSGNMSQSSIGLSSAATGLERRIAVAKLGQLTTGAQNRMVFVAPGSGAKIVGARLGFDALMYHAAGEVDTWIFQLKNKSAASGNATLIKNAASLSGVSIAATGFKVLPLNNGNSSMNAYAGLQLVMTVSGTAQTLTNCSAFIEWVPLNNA